MDLLTFYLPLDRRFALAEGVTLPDRMHGAALFADAPGFTSLTEALARELGSQRGAEELTLHLNQVFDFEDMRDQAGMSQVLHYAGTLAAQQGDYEQARLLDERSLTIRRELGDTPQTASLLSNLGIIARFRGDYDTARILHEEGLAIRRALRDKWGIAVSVNNLGNVALDQNNLADARDMARGSPGPPARSRRPLVGRQCAQQSWEPGSRPR